MGGTFQMGGVQGSDGRAVTLRSFMIDAREVTVAEFEAFCLDTGRSMPAAPRWGWTRRDLPVVNVTWDEAAAFAAWMGKRLPTEAEFEYVMRAGGLANTLYPWGDTFLATAANCLGQVGAPTPAGTYAAGPLGLFDLTGNVWEWCSDWYEPLLSGPADNPTGPASGDHKVMRGGSWVSTERKLTCSSRHFMLPGARYSDLGFRCAMNVGPAKDADAGSGTGGLQTVPGNVPPNDTVPETLDEQPLLPHPLVELGPWAGAWDLGQGWRWMDWFGYFAAGPEPWIYHAEHAWMYAVGTSAASLWLWTPDLGWLWTADEVYPFLYSAARQTWLFYAKDSRGPRWFFNWAAQRWEAR
jgi:iron(II)-dependent oxidoreductase